MENNKNYIAHWFIALFCSLVLLMILVWAFRAEWETKIETPKILEVSEKENVVADVKYTEIKWPKYTVRVGYEGKRKPIPVIISVTNKARSAEWLIASWSDSDIDVWARLWKKYKIDYTLPICIAWADSHLWKALKSRNNVGNIWNNDRWGVRHFETLEAWIEAIFWSLAKWKYMSGHNTIGTLSGEGRRRLWLPWCAEEKDYRKKCYASSMGVWSTNVTNCMSALHDKQIDENYNFRIK